MIYYVTLYNEGLWDNREATRIEADSPAEAAHQVAGESMDDAGPVGRLRATVRTTTDAAPVASFYRRLS